MKLVPPLLDLRRPCNGCGHTFTWHSTDDERCTYEIVDSTNNAWMRCACDRWHG